MKRNRLGYVLYICSKFLRLIAVAVLLLWLWIWTAIVDGPPVPDLMTGKVVPTANHGHDVYITLLQSHLLHCLIPALFALGIASELIRRMADKLAANRKQ